MKLLMITGDCSLAQGKKGAFYNTLEEFSKHWERIDIICPKTEVKILSLFNNVFIHSNPEEKICQPWWILKRGKEIFKEQKFDLFTVHDYPPFYNGLGAWLLSKKIRVPYVIEIMHIIGYPRAANLKEWAYKIITKLFVRFSVKRATMVRTINPGVKDFLSEHGVDRLKIKVVPAFYIDLDIFKSQTHKKEYDIICIGRLEKNKGFDLLVKAISLIKVFSPGIRALIVGDGPEFENLKNKINELGLNNDIVLYGWANDANEIAELINKSKIMMITSFNEGGPRVALEAMACGIPVVTTRVGIMNELIKDGENGLFIDWKDKNIARKIWLLLEDQVAKQKFSQAGLDIVKDFEKKKAISDYASALKSIIKQ